MEIYIDESGSINNNIKLPFIISIIVVKDKIKLKNIFKKYIRKKILNFKSKKCYKSMFDDKKLFKELKGSVLRYEDKIEFIDYFCQNNLFDIYYIKINNNKLYKKLYENVNMTFNYSLRLFVENILINYYQSKEYILNIDNRNIKLRSLNHLQEYLNTEIGIKKDLEFKVNYFQSEKSVFIQLADVFSNIYYSNLINKKYEDKFKYLKENNYLIKVFEFPK